MKKNNGLSFFIPKKETGLDAILINTGISAGFPSPAGDYKQERISLDKELMYGDVLREVDSHGKVVWEWKSWEHLNFEHHIICPIENRSEWTHANSIYVMPDDNVLVSLRNTNMVIIIEKLTGDVIWEWGSTYLEHQHHATLLDPNKILVLDNLIKR